VICALAEALRAEELKAKKHVKVIFGTTTGGTVGIVVVVVGATSSGTASFAYKSRAFGLFLGQCDGEFNPTVD
jgi:hypothetical protein